MKPRLVVQLIVVSAISMFVCLMPQNILFAAGECKGDIARYCQGAEGPKQEMECLKMNKERLSPPCKRHIVQVLRAVIEAHQDCEPEIYMFCPGVQPGGGRVMKCLKAHKNELSPACKAGIMDMLMSR